ncbi:peptide deformylase [Patescibacteria group bacterium]
MSVYKLTYHPNDLLRTELDQVTLKKLASSDMQKLIDNMIETMYAKNGIGIAANQVGYNHQIAIISTADGPQVIVNPTISRKSILKENGEEGCLSVPGVFGMVKRFKGIVLRGYDRTGKNIVIKAKGMHARVIQHEVDHLNGTLCIDRMTRITQGKMPDGRKEV